MAFFIISVCFFNVCKPFSYSQGPKYSIDLCKNLHFLNFTFKPAAFDKTFNYLLKPVLCSVIVEPTTILLSINIPMLLRPAVEISIAFWNSLVDDFVLNRLRV